MKLKSFSLLLLLPVLALALPGCALFSNAGKRSDVMAQPIDESGTNSIARLHVGDAVAITFSGLPDPMDAQEKPIKDDGTITLQDIGRIKAVGKTSKELAADIKTALEKDYYKQATVVLSLNLANRILGRVYIWGQVRTQGPLDIQINENLTAGQAILRAGGLGDFANKTKVKVVRAATGPNGEKKVFELNMEDILQKGKVEQDIVLKPDDFIIVPTRLINF